MAPYQPILLRLLHGSVAVLMLAAWATGFWVYNTFDRRWGQIPLPRWQSVQDIHGTIALIFLILLPFFALYCFHLGFQRLAQERTWPNLHKVNQTQGWRAWHQITNTVMLGAATLAVMTGRMMDEAWLPRGEFHHVWYTLHLLAWAVVFLGVLGHLLVGLKVGGGRFLASMWRTVMQEQDRPRGWFRAWRGWSGSWVLRITEVVILGGIGLAFILPVFKELGS